MNLEHDYLWCNFNAKQVVEFGVEISVSSTRQINIVNNGKKTAIIREGKFKIVNGDMQEMPISKRLKLDVGTQFSFNVELPESVSEPIYLIYEVNDIDRLAWDL
jgi:hypothetical protein